MRRKGGMRKLLLKLYFILSYAIKEEEIKEGKGEETIL